MVGGPLEYNQNSMSLLEQLNPRQREAVTATGDPLLVLAGAGSGKTRVIAYRIAYLMDCLGVQPENILAVTFTNKAADEMRMRVESLLGRGAAGLPWISTFHSFCVRLLRRDGPAGGISRDFTIYDEDDQLAVVRKAMKELSLDESFMRVRAVLTRISHAKNHGISPQIFRANASDRRNEQLATIYEHYQAALGRSNALDFDDLLLEAVRLLATSPETAAKYNQRFQHLLVDEYQDINRPQYEMIRLLTQVHRNLCVVGDEDQSIYGWRGADLRNILEFEQDFPSARIIRLEQNYRSTKTILTAASAVVAHNEFRIGKTLWTENPQGECLGLYEAPDDENEALFVADWLSSYMKENPEGRAAVLFRSSARLRRLEDAMRRYGLKYRVVAGTSFYQRAEIKDLLAYLKFAQNPEDSLSLLRIINIPPRGIGKKTVEQLEGYALEHNVALWQALEGVLKAKLLRRPKHETVAEFRQLADDLVALAQAEAPATELLSAVLDRTGYVTLLEEEAPPEASSRVENIQELLNATRDSVERGETLAEFLDHAALVSEADDYDERAGITLMTLHAAKGLEFPVVFLVGLEEGLFPHSRSVQGPAGLATGLEEERRLCYVGMTRAQQRLILTRAEFRRQYGAALQGQTEPSQFLEEIPGELLENLGRPRRRKSAATYSGAAYNSVEDIARFFAVRGVVVRSGAKGPQVQPARGESGIQLGQRVRHHKFGVGTVVHREGDGEGAKLTVSFPDYGLRKLMEKYAGLQKA